MSFAVCKATVWACLPAFLAAASKPASADVDAFQSLASVTPNIWRNLESPQAGPVSGVGVIRGWAFSDLQGETITLKLYLDGQAVADVPCCSQRPDVEGLFWLYPYPRANTLNSGWGLTFNWGNLPAGLHTVRVDVRSSSGEVVSTDTRSVSVVKPGNFPYLDVFDLSGAAVRIDGETLVLENVRVRDKATLEERQVDLQAEWQVESQTFGLVASSDRAQASGSSGLWGRLARRVAGVFRLPAAEASPVYLERLEDPVDGPVAGVDILRGWVFATGSSPGAGPASVELVVDGQTAGSIPCCSDRLDVQAHFPQYDAAATLKSGYGTTFNWGNLSAGPHTLRVDYQTGLGTLESSDTRTVEVVKPGGYDWLDYLTLASAAPHLEGQDIVLEGVSVRDGNSQDIVTVGLRLRWSPSSQALATVASWGP